MRDSDDAKTKQFSLGHKMVLTVVYLYLTAAVVYLLFFNLEPGAPIRQWIGGKYDRLTWDRQLAAMDQGLIDDAAGGNLELHFEGFHADAFDQGIAMCRFYFRGNYALYPRQIFVGSADRIINGAADIKSADIVPEDRWLAERGVRGVQSLTRGEDGHVHGDFRAIP